MARINYSSQFTDNVTLFKSLRAKHVADAGTSVLTAYLTAEGINLTTDNTNVDAASAAHIVYLQAERDAEKFTNERNRLFDPCLSDHKRCVQFLKKLNQNNINVLGDWAVTVNNNSRIVYPSDFTELSTAITNFITKHGTYAAGTSPLQPFLTQHSIDLTVNQTAINSSVTADTSSRTNYTSRETHRELRDSLFDRVMMHVRDCGGFLVILFDTNPRKAGDWGYAIDDSPLGTKERTISILKGGVKLINKCVLNSIMTNTGSIPLDIFPGKTEDGTPITVAAGGSFKLVLGFSTFTVKNNSLTEKGEITVTVRK